MQPQGQLQTLVRMLDYGQQPQAACDAPRWKWNSGLTVDVEPALGASMAEGCARVAMSWKDWTTLTWTSAPASSSGVWATRPWTVMSAPATAGATGWPPAFDCPAIAVTLRLKTTGVPCMASIGTKSYDAVVAQKVAFLGLGVMGRPWPAIWRAPATTSPSITARPPRRRPGPPNSAAAMPPRRAKQSRAPRSCSPASATTTTCAAWPGGRRVRRHGAGRGLRRPHHRLGGRGPRAVRASQELGLNFIDAPVSGGQAGAVNGALTIMCGGEQAVFDAIAGGPGLRARRHAGGSPGAGQLAKMVNQICIAGIVQGLSEAVAFGQAADLDMKLVLDVISKGAAQSWQMETVAAPWSTIRLRLRGGLDAQGPGPGTGRSAQQRRPVALDRAGGPVLRRCAEMGGGRWDTSSLISACWPKRATTAPGCP